MKEEEGRRRRSGCGVEDLKEDWGFRQDLGEEEGKSKKKKKKKKSAGNTREKIGGAGESQLENHSRWSRRSRWIAAGGSSWRSRRIS